MTEIAVPWLKFVREASRRKYYYAKSTTMTEILLISFAPLAVLIRAPPVGCSVSRNSFLLVKQAERGGFARSTMVQ